MSAEVFRISAPRQKAGVVRHLAGRSRPAGRAMHARMEGSSAVRNFVANLARSLPLADGPGRPNVWGQVADVLAVVPSLATTCHEIQTMAHAAMTAIGTGRRGAGVRTVDIRAGEVRFVAHRHRLRMVIAEAGATRIIDFRLKEDGATRIDDHDAEGRHGRRRKTSQRRTVKASEGIAT